MDRHGTNIQSTAHKAMREEEEERGWAQAGCGCGVEGPSRSRCP